MPQHLLGRSLRALHAKLVCPACAAFLKFLVGQISSHVADSIEHWGDFEYHRGSSVALVNPSTDRRRRLDFHAKRFVVQVSIQQNLAKNSSAAGRSMDKVHRAQSFRWVKEEMAAFQVAGHISSKRSDTFAIVYDCARIGQPAKEMMLAVFRNLQAKATVVLSPQVGPVGMPIGPDAQSYVQGAGRAGTLEIWVSADARAEPIGIGLY